MINIQNAGAVMPINHIYVYICIHTYIQTPRKQGQLTREQFTTKPAHHGRMMTVETGSIEALRLLPPTGVQYDEEPS